MNKFKLYILGLGLASMGFASCTADFLDVESKRESTTDNFYRTESDAWRALIGCYDGWQCTTSSAGCAFYYASEIMYNPQIQISAESETKRSIFREKDKTKRSKKESAQHSKSRNKSFVMTSVSAL